MYKFYFNDCLPQNKSKHEIISCFLKSLREYKTIETKYRSDVVGIITSKQTDAIVLNESNFTLKTCILSLEKDIKEYALSSFTKYPVENYFITENIEGLFDYFVTVGNNEYDAWALKLAQENEGILFSLALHSDLQRNTLSINDKNDCEYSVLNLFGETDNTDFIAQTIHGYVVAKLGNFERLLAVIGNCSFSKQFQDGFNKASTSAQVEIIACFQHARNRNGITPFYADDKIIKEAKGVSEKNVFELKTSHSVAYRVYFFETLSKVYLALAEKKPTHDVQSVHIQNASRIIKKLMN